MTTVYIKDGKEFASEWKFRQAHPELIFPELSEEVMKMIGVTKEEREDPEPTPEEIEAKSLEEAKRVRVAKVAAITVEVDGMVFDGDETAQSRMTRVVTAADVSGVAEAQWVMADNSVATVTIAQLRQALSKATLEMTTLWTAPYSTGGKA